MQVVMKGCFPISEKRESYRRLFGRGAARSQKIGGA